jgi:hypothetical protein
MVEQYCKMKDCGISPILFKIPDVFWALFLSLLPCLNSISSHFANLCISKAARELIYIF